MKVLLFDIHTGISGDMILAALFDLGLDFKAWQEIMLKLPLPPWEIQQEKVSREGIAATQIKIHYEKQNQHRGLKEILQLINTLPIDKQVVQQASQIFTRLGEVEAKIHAILLEDVHFHELGAMDTIVDIVGVCLGFQLLGFEKFYVTPFTFGLGKIKIMHGQLAEPAPASLALSQGFPSRRIPLEAELCTPTGMAIATHFARPISEAPDMILEKIGYGAGSREYPGVANVLRLCQMQTEENTGNSFPDQVFQIECNLDSMTPEALAYAAEKLLESGCLDVWQNSIVMKKGRAATQLNALVEKKNLQLALSTFIQETNTGGVRYFPVHRKIGKKTKFMIKTRWGELEFKQIDFTEPTITRYTPEYESCKTLAQVAGLTLSEIYAEAAQCLVHWKKSLLKNPQDDSVEH